MTEPRLVQCKKLGKLLPGLPKPPYKNALGQRIFEEISKEAWDGWVKESVRFVNTYRLDLTTPDGRKFMYDQAAVYFGFEDGKLADTAWTPSADGGAGEPGAR